MKKQRRSTAYIIISLLILIPGLYLAVESLLEIKAEVVLTLIGRTTSADVDAHRVRSTEDGIRIYEVRYSFSIDEKVYSYTEDTGGWAQLPKEQWEAAVEKQTIQALYMPDKPEINTPLYMENRSFIRNAAKTAIFLTLSLVCGIIIVINLHTILHRQ